MSKPVIFTIESAKRIASTVRAVETHILGRTEDRHPQAPYTPSVITDTQSYSTLKTPYGRKTLNRNLEAPADQAHRGAHELHNVSKVLELSYSLPFFNSDVLQAGYATGELYWATLDANRVADDAELVYRSLAAADTHATSSKGKYSLSLYGFTGCAAHQVPYSQAVTNPAGSGRELIWRCPVAIEGDPIAGETGTIINFVQGLTNVTPPVSGSYASVSVTSRAAVVHKGALDYASSAPEYTAYLPLSLSYTEITPNIEHNLLAGTATVEPPAWTATNNGHDGRYLRIGKNWATGEDYHNTCTGIAHFTTGERAIDFANGLLFGDTPAEGATIDYGARKLYAFDGSQLETVDWGECTLRNPTTSVETVDWGDCTLRNPATSAVVLNWDTYKASNATRETLDWNAGKLSGPVDGWLKVDWSAQKLYTEEEGAEVVTVNWTSRTLSSPGVLLPWKATSSFRITNGGNYIDLIAIGGGLQIKDQSGTELAFFSADIGS